MNYREFKMVIGALLVGASSFAAAQTGISVTINGDPVGFPGTGPQMIEGRVLVPLRGVFEKIGAAVQWHPDKREVIASRGTSTVDLIIGSTNATVNGQSVTLDVPAQILNGSTMVPIRFVSEAIGAEVKWRDQEKIVVITVDATQPANSGPNPAPAVDGPIRMSRISWIDGGVLWRPGDDVDWSFAANNLPLRQGAQIWLNPGARAEIQFDDGSFVRLGNGALAIFQTMFADDRGEFSEVRLNTGTASFRLTNRLSTYQIDTPLAAITSTGVSNFRIDDTTGLTLNVRAGQTSVQGDAGQITLRSGQSLRLRDGNSPYIVSAAPYADGWDRFCDGRDNGFLHPSPYLPSSIAIVAGDLNSYGNWVNDPQYGYCWHPTMAGPGWAPYHNGHWVWVSPFGWTWCGNEPWGWAPYHYGTWFYGSVGWLWHPGPAQQPWSPAVVHLSTYHGAIAWCPLAPAEVRYPPTVSIQFRAGNWAANFSIGGAASYYNAGGGYCTPRPWRNGSVNTTTTFYNVNRVSNIQSPYVSNNGFIPRNSLVPGGATATNLSGFSGRVAFTSGNVAAADIFKKGQGFAPPSGAAPQFAGPTNVRPTATSFSPAPSLTRQKPGDAVLRRTVVRAPIPARVAGSAPNLPSSRTLATAGTKPTRPVTPTAIDTSSISKSTKPGRGNPANYAAPAKPVATPSTAQGVKSSGSKTKKGRGGKTKTTMSSTESATTPSPITEPSPIASSTTPRVKTSPPAKTGSTLKTNGKGKSGSTKKAGKKKTDKSTKAAG